VLFAVIVAIGLGVMAAFVAKTVTAPAKRPGPGRPGAQQPQRRHLVRGRQSSDRARPAPLVVRPTRHISGGS
jgi:hypothetical protein